MKVSLLVKNGRIVSPEGTISGWIGIEGEKIAALGTGDLVPEATKVIDAGGRYVIPGLVDPHVHMNWPDWPMDKAVAASSSCVFGGVTTLIHFMLEPGSLVEGLRQLKATFESNSFVDGAFHAAIFTREHVREIAKMPPLGVTSFKFFLPYRGEEVVPPLAGIDDGILFTGMREVGKLGQKAVAMIHCENVEPSFKLKEEFIEQGRTDIHWTDVRPPFCEAEAMRRAAFFGKVTGASVYVVHMTIGDGVNIIKKAWDEGININAETCPQYLTLTAQGTDRVLGKVNPPLRGRDDNDQLWAGIRAGVVNYIGSDHAPCSRKHKQEFWKAIVGFAGIETMLPVLLSEGVNKGRVSLERLVEVCCYNPAKFFGLAPKKGIIRVGSDADLVILDMKKKVTVTAKSLHHLSDFTPFEGKEVQGWPILTMVRGSIVMEQGKVLGKPGTGRYLPRSC